MKLTLVCLGLMMLLVLMGTLDQVHLGTYAAQKKYFDSVWVRDAWFFGLRLPSFPGGMFIGGLWVVNLLAAHADRFSFSRKKAGIMAIHLGLLFLVLGQFFTQVFAKESQMALDEGATLNYSESLRDTELAVVMVSDPAFDEVTSIPEALFRREGDLRTPGLPFRISVKKYFRNAALSMASPEAPALSSHGVGARVSGHDAPPVTADDEVDNVSAVIEIRDGGKDLGTWLVSSALGAPQSVTVGGKEYMLSIRPTRHYYPFQLTLKDFTHEKYLGTEVPMNFSSNLRLSHPEKNENRDVLIYMNHPLRYDGKTFYQASFAKQDTMSILQVVENPFWLTPYFAAALMALGLAWQFLTHLVSFLSRRSA